MWINPFDHIRAWKNKPKTIQPGSIITKYIELPKEIIRLKQRKNKLKDLVKVITLKFRENMRTGSDFSAAVDILEDDILRLVRSAKKGTSRGKASR